MYYGSGTVANDVTRARRASGQQADAAYAAAARANVIDAILKV